MWNTKIITILILLSCATASFGSEAVQRLDQFFKEVDSFEGQFKQTVLDENGEVIQDSSGDVALDKPGRFRWQYVKPYPQLILADGKYLWIYDEELLQATAKPIEEALGNAPIMLLTDIRPLDQDFKIMEVSSRDGLDWVELVPLIKDTEFHLISIGLSKDGIKKMELHDQFAQKTVIEFVGLKKNVSFPSDYFKFTASGDIDIVGYPGN